MTLTAQVQLAGACTTSICAPRLDCAVTDCPDGPVSLTAGVPVGDDPTGVTNTWNDDPAAGAGAHLKAQPMFQPAAVVVNAGLFQLPWSCVGPMRTRAGPDAAAVGVDVVVDPPTAAVVVVDPPAAAVVVVDTLDPLADDVVDVVDPVDAGNLYAGAFVDWVVVPAVVPFNAIPTTSAARIATRSCHVLQVRFSLMWSSPGRAAGHRRSSRVRSERDQCQRCCWAGAEVTFLNRGRDFVLRQDTDVTAAPTEHR